MSFSDTTSPPSFRRTTTGLVTVATPSGPLKSNRKFLVTRPSQALPPSGAESDPVTITGVSLTGATNGGVCGARRATFTVDSDTQISTTVPNGARWTGKIQVTTPGGTAVSATNSP